MTDEEKAEEYTDKMLSNSKYPFIFNKEKVRAYIIKVYLDSLKWCEEAYNKGLAVVWKENAELKAQIEQMKCCSNCKNFNRDFELCFFSGGDKDYHCRNRRWELVE